MAQTTKKALASSLKQLLTSKTLDKITVSDLTELCGVNRQTFYYHFKDIYDLLEWIYKEDSTKVLPETVTDENWSIAYMKIFQYIQDNRALVMNTYHSAHREIVLSYVHRESFMIMRKVVDYYAEGIKVSEEDKDFLAAFYEMALVDILLKWLDMGMKEDPREIVRRISVIMEGTLKSAMIRLERSERIPALETI